MSYSFIFSLNNVYRRTVETEVENVLSYKRACFTEEYYFRLLITAIVFLIWK